MFGGLDLKGGDDENAPAPAPAATIGSAFGFMNSAPAAVADTPAAAVAAAPAASSAFSFLNSTVSAPAPTAPASTFSSFSFLQETTAPTPTPPPPVPVVQTVPEPVESGFSFLIPSPDKAGDSAAAAAAAAPSSETTTPTASAPVSDEPQESSYSVPMDESAPAPATASAFSFLSAAPSPTPESVPWTTPPPVPVPIPPTPATTMSSRTNSSSSEIPSTTTTNTQSALQLGNGITFGAAAVPAKTNVVRKKKTRAQKVGVAASAAATPSTTTAAAAAATASTVKSPSPVPTEDSHRHHQPQEGSTRSAAVEAQRRAEQFMNQKSLEQATALPAPVIPTYDNIPSIGHTPSTDEEVAMAKLAAEEAQKMASSAQGRPKGFMGTFFKGFGGSNSNLPAASVDRLSKQQHEMNRAAAERQIQLQKQPSDDDDGDMVTVTTSTTGYKAADSTKEDISPKASSVPLATTTTSTTTTTTTTTPSILSSFENSNGTLKSDPSQKIVVKELTPAPKKKKTPIQVFEEYQALFAQSVHRAMQQADAVRSQQKMLQEERFVALAKERLYTQQVQQTEEQLQVAVEKEDYELADQLGQVIEAHNREKAELASMLDSVAKGLEQLESQKALVVQGIATCFDNLAIHIKELQEQANANDRGSDPETLKQFAIISKQLSAEQERLQQDCKLLERDEQLVAEERKELENAISEQSGEYERQRDNVKEKLTVVEEEIEELRRQIESKSKIAAGLRTEMHGLEDNISKVRVKFARQLTRVDKKERSLHENRVDWESEQAAFKRQKEAHELQVKSHSEALLAQDALMQSLETELQMCKEFAGMVPTKLGFMQDEMKTNGVEEANEESDLAQLQADVVKCEAAKNEAKLLLKAATAAIVSLEKEHAFLIARIPQLEADKKAAAVKRDFKAASKASKEIKDATARLKECEEELVGDAADKKKAAEAEMEKLEIELEASRKVANEKEKISGVSKMESLAKQIKHLTATKAELCGDVSSTENSVKGVGAFVLDCQIKALMEEGEALGSKYGGWEEITGGGAVETSTPKEPASEEIESSPPVAAEPVDDGLSSEERIAKVRDLIKRIQQAEESLEAAVEREDYDEAARLQEVFEKLQMELDNVNLTEEESEIAFSDDVPPTSQEMPVENGTAENGPVESKEESAEMEKDDEVTPADESNEEVVDETNEESNDSTPAQNHDGASEEDMMKDDETPVVETNPSTEDEVITETEDPAPSTTDANESEVDQNVEPETEED